MPDTNRKNFMLMLSKIKMNQNMLDGHIVVTSCPAFEFPLETCRSQGQKIPTSSTDEWRNAIHLSFLFFVLLVSQG